MTGENLYAQALKEMSKNEPNLAKAFELLQRALTMQNANAAYALGTWYLHGRFVKRDPSNAVRLLKLAAAKNIPAALYDLAVCYEKGTGERKDKTKAYELYLRAAVWGDNDAIYEVGRCLYYGIGVNRSKRIGNIWLDRAKSLGHKPPGANPKP